MRLLCWLGIHDWGCQYNVRGGYGGNIMLLAIIKEFTNPRKCDRKCLRCGKVKEFVYESGR